MSISILSLLDSPTTMISKIRILNLNLERDDLMEVVQRRKRNSLRLEEEEEGTQKLVHQHLREEKEGTLQSRMIQNRLTTRSNATCSEGILHHLQLHLHFNNLP